MFTGIVETKLPVLQPTPTEEGMEFGLDLSGLAGEVRLGDSVAVDGCCLTVAELDGGVARFHAGRETLSLTSLGGIGEGSTVNVERALAFGDQLGGHLVSGHIDGVGEVTAIDPEESQTIMRYRIPERLADQVILKGSISLDGVSLTLISVDGPEVAVALIPHTLEVTTLGDKKVGDPVNVETDMIGKWILQQTAPITDELKSLLAKQGGESR